MLITKLSNLLNCVNDIYICLILTFVVAFGSLANGQDEGVDFSHEIVPVLRKHCYECHGAENANGGFSINSRELMLDSGAIDLEDPDRSIILELISCLDDDLRMPPKELARITPAEVDLFRKWITVGLPWEAGFSFTVNQYRAPLKPRRPLLPKGTAENPIDLILNEYLLQNNAKLPEALNDSALLRRLSLDLNGLLPSIEASRSFEEDKSDKKYELIVDRLLAHDRDYAEHWFTFWNDLLRNDFVGTGYIEGGRKQISKWLYHALLENLPYDIFVRDIISPTSDSEGFINGIQWRGNVNASQTRNIQFAQNISQVFLGINMKCASCHDSFIDHWTLNDTYGLAAIYADEPLEKFRCDKPTGSVVGPRWIYPELGQIDAQAPKDARLRQLAALMTHPENGRLSRTIVNRLWHQLMGRGIVHPIDAMNTPPWSEDLLDYLAVYLADHNYDLKAVLRLITTSKAYRSRVVAMNEQSMIGNYVFKGPISRRMTAEQFLDAIWKITDTSPTKAHPSVQSFLSKNKKKETREIRASLVSSDLLQRTLGRPNREQVVSTRPREMTMLQSLDLSNGEIMSNLISQAALQVENKWQGMNQEQMIKWLYESAFSRLPTDSEVRLSKEILGTPSKQQGIEDLLWTLFMLPEFQLIR